MALAEDHRVGAGPNAFHLLVAVKPAQPAPLG
jgi:hypothetical protein